MRLPTLRLFDTRKGREIVINAHQYAGNIARYGTRFRIIGETRGSADDTIVARQRRLDDAEDLRARNPAHPASSDATRRHEANRAPIVIDAGEGETANWRAMPWFKARALIRALTGILPDSKVHAERLMNERAGERDRS